jgi:3-oxoacyl-[acyl-carrier protein] reductase
MSLEGKVAFVTGSSRPKGNGRAIALALAEKGVSVAVTGKENFNGALSLAQEINKLGKKSVAVKIDLCNYTDVKKGLNQIKQELGAIDILVNNAALMGHNIPIHKTTAEEFDNEVRVCLNSAFYCIKEVWADMCARKWGRIINISSVAGVMGGYGQSSYSAAKAGLLALAKTAAIEGARFNITANAVMIGISETDAYFELPELVQERVAKRTLWGKAAEPKDIAGAVAYLASDEAKYMTGATINMMGGLDLFVF